MKQLYFIDMAIAGHMNGVTRCIQVLVNSFSKEEDFAVTWMHFENSDKCNTLQTEQRNGYTYVFVSLPRSLGDFLLSEQRQVALWTEVMPQILNNVQPNEPLILHVHTLNLIKFALFIRERRDCRIVTHLHCIPWKALYNRNLSLFLELYERYYIRHDYSQPAAFILYRYEELCYTQSDCLICVTQCARKFIHDMFPSRSLPVHVVYNGIADMVTDESAATRFLHQPVRLLFVGNAHDSKGLRYILESMEILRMRHETELVVAGAISPSLQNHILKEHPFLDIQFKGILSFPQLRESYSSCDIGIIASLQEQCSYVAIEMMMHGLPVVTTDIDGLRELFPGHLYACKIPVKYIPGKAFVPDVHKMADALSLLIQNPQLRSEFGRKARGRYKDKYTDDRMIESIKKIYNHLT